MSLRPTQDHTLPSQRESPLHTLKDVLSTLPSPSSLPERKKEPESPSRIDATVCQLGEIVSDNETLTHLSTAVSVPIVGAIGMMADTSDSDAAGFMSPRAQRSAKRDAKRAEFDAIRKRMAEDDAGPNPTYVDLKDMTLYERGKVLQSVSNLTAGADGNFEELSTRDLEIVLGEDGMASLTFMSDKIVELLGQDDVAVGLVEDGYKQISRIQPELLKSNSEVEAMGAMRTSQFTSAIVSTIQPTE